MRSAGGVACGVADWITARGGEYGAYAHRLGGPLSSRPLSPRPCKAAAPKGPVFLCLKLLGTRKGRKTTQKKSKFQGPHKKTCMEQPGLTTMTTTMTKICQLWRPTYLPPRAPRKAAPKGAGVAGEVGRYHGRFCFCCAHALMCGFRYKLPPSSEDRKHFGNNGIFFLRFFKVRFLYMSRPSRRRG